MEVPDPAEMRRHYQSVGLSEADAPADPLHLFAAWFADTVAAGVYEPNAMVLATTGVDGWPQARTVLLKGFDERGLRFFTNTRSAKADQLAVSPRAALVFPWHAIARQIRVVGRAVPLPHDEVVSYFATRPRDSQLGAWASPQSSVVSSRTELDAMWVEAQLSFPEGTEVPVPHWWGGYRVEPVEWEFWAGRPARMHDRLRYRRTDTETGTTWHIQRLAP